MTIGGVTLLLGVAAALFVSDRPEKMGLSPVKRGALRACASAGSGDRRIPSIAGNLRTWPPLLASAGIYGTLVAFVGLWGVPYLTQIYGPPRVEASNIWGRVEHDAGR